MKRWYQEREGGEWGWNVISREAAREREREKESEEEMILKSTERDKEMSGREERKR